MKNHKTIIAILITIGAALLILLSVNVRILVSTLQTNVPIETRTLRTNGSSSIPLDGDVMDVLVQFTDNPQLTAPAHKLNDPNAVISGVYVENAVLTIKE